MKSLGVVVTRYTAVTAPLAKNTVSIHVSIWRYYLCASGTPPPSIGTPTLWLQELDLRYTKARVLLSAVKEEGTVDKDVDPFHRGNKKVSDADND